MLLPRVAGRDFPPLDLVEVIVVEITHTHKHLTMFKDSSPKLACPNGVAAVVSPGCCSSLETGNPSRKTLGQAKKLRNQKSRDLVHTLETGPAVTKTNTAWWARVKSWEISPVSRASAGFQTENPPGRRIEIALTGADWKPIRTNVGSRIDKEKTEMKNPGTAAPSLHDSAQMTPTK